MSAGSSSHASATQALEISSKYFFEDLFLQVENTLYKVNRRDFEEGSVVFRDMFQLPNGGKTVEGCSAEKPIVLESIKAADMDHFLAAIYPRPFKGIDYYLSLDAWKAVYKLAELWQFSYMHKRALVALKDNMVTAPGVDAIRIYAELALDLDQVFVAAVRKLVVRQEDISEEEARSLELATVMRICKLRGWYAALGPLSTATGTVDAEVRQAWKMPPPPPAALPLFGIDLANPRKRRSSGNIWGGSG
ncbi:hypothetical protein PsYK624_082920 [Phanerochaete sordida]|uniref:BTB domain-containing protein n=1 Tax=Phanerochaete sordida TaxID=48140 RepID=A0A9P3LF12_9APHY|nr:hypothetical protein PsYK624_082920 [Phanerochaete sordida]